MYPLILSIFGTAADLFAKHTIEAMPENYFPHPVSGGFLTLERHHNYGFAHNRLENRPALVKGLVTGLYGLLLLMLLKEDNDRPATEKAGYALILGGGFSNTFERLMRGYVVDYLRFRGRKLSRVIMNLGDLMLFAGSFLAVFSVLSQLFSGSGKE